MIKLIKKFSKSIQEFNLQIKCKNNVKNPSSIVLGNTIQIKSKWLKRKLRNSIKNKLIITQIRLPLSFKNQI